MNYDVVIVTCNRPQCVAENLRHLRGQCPTPSRIVVVDASPNDRTRAVLEEWPDVIYVRNPRGLGHTTHSRNLGLLETRSPIITFLDDDAYARPGWARALLRGFEDPSVGGVAGRALNGQPGEEAEGIDRIGRLTRNGEVLGFFAADPGAPVEVDHAIGCNMAIRRDVLARAGGFREGFSGRYCLREESDVFVVMKQMGCRVVFLPDAVVDHVGAPKPRGRRFDMNYAYFRERNHYILLIRNFGPAHSIVWRYAAVSACREARDLLRQLARAGVWAAANLAGALSGVFNGTRWWWLQGRDAARTDELGRRVTAALISPTAEPAATPSQPAPAAHDAPAHPPDAAPVAVGVNA